MNSDKTPKVILCGNSTVGKTTLLLRLAKGVFEENVSTTTACSFSSISYTVNDKTYFFNAWDTAGQEAYRSLIKIYFRQANIALIVIDVTQPNGLDGISDWVKQIKNGAQEDVIMILVANKIDLDEQRQISQDDLKITSEKFGFSYIEVSSKSGEGIKPLLELLVTSWETINSSAKKNSFEAIPKETPKTIDLNQSQNQNQNQDQNQNQNQDQNQNQNQDQNQEATNSSGCC